MKMEYLGISTISAMHEHIINTVIENTRLDFVEDGVGEDVLQKLRAIWEMKISEKNVAPSLTPVAQSSSPVKDLSVGNNRGKKRSVRSAGYARSYPKCSKTAFQAPPGIELCGDVRVLNDVCNRSMPLLTSEEENEPTPLLKNSMVEMIPVVKEQNLSVQQGLSSEPEIIRMKTIQSKKHGLDLLLRSKGINKTLAVKIRRLENTIIIKQAPIEPNNNVVQKKGRGRPKKYASVTEPRRRGRPRLFKNRLKINGLNQIKESISTSAQDCAKNGYQHCTIIQTDGVSGNPKFNVKPKLTGIPVTTKHERLGESDLNTDDDMTDSEDLAQTFECANIINCQYEKVKRVKNQWKISLKHGIMHLKGKDYVFNNARCDVQW